MTGKRQAVIGIALAVVMVAGLAAAGEKGHGSMSGMSGGSHKEEHGSMHGMKDEGKMEGHGMMKMGDKVFEGKIGSWHGEARLMDMKAQMEKAKASGMKMEGMTKTHHLSVLVTDPATKKQVSEGKGSVVVTGPGGKSEKTDFMAMQGHFGTDITIDEPGKYEFSVEIESGGKKGTAAFHHTVK